jgi:hypothetical protein
MLKQVKPQRQPPRTTAVVHAKAIIGATDILALQRELVLKGIIEIHKAVRPQTRLVLTVPQVPTKTMQRILMGLGHVMAGLSVLLGKVSQARLRLKATLGVVRAHRVQPIVTKTVGPKRAKIVTATTVMPALTMFAR